MKTSFYPKLAWDGIRKNRQLYLPYIFTGCVMVMMYYILSFLSESPAVAQMEGGSAMGSILPLGAVVIGVFSVLFLFYTNSFLIKQRYREFGLYNMLGMDKRNICRLMVWETLFIGAASITLGLLAGVILSKLAELGLMNLLGMAITYDLRVGLTSLWKTPAVFGGIYLLLLINSLIRVSVSRPLALMQSSRAGERVPKGTWLLALVGVALLTAAYYLAVSIQEPLDALIWFFGAVLLVIPGTYLLFISGSVALCKLLQANKKYYYHPNHFVSVSSMVYRMKRNGAGLASICILLTMVLVMIASTSCLYFGAEDSVLARCPNNINIAVEFDRFEGMDREKLASLRDTIRPFSGTDADLLGIRACGIPGVLTDKGILIDIDSTDLSDYSTYRDGYLSVIPLSDYNHMMGLSQTLSEDECLLYISRMDYPGNSFAVEHGKTYRVKEHLTQFKVDGETLVMTIPVVYLVVSDLESFAAPFRNLKNSAGSPITVFDWRCGFDMENTEAELRVEGALEKALLAARNNGDFFSSSIDVFSRTDRRNSFYEMYGSLFFLGIMLSIVFLMAAVLIVYYKQICEGYEDRARFEIMQKVGMTRRDIRRSINSQMLTVFFLPLVLAGVHLAFAFPFISKILLMFAFSNTVLNILVNVACFAVFGIFYGFVYKITSGAYFRIVSGSAED